MEYNIYKDQEIPGVGEFGRSVQESNIDIEIKPSHFEQYDGSFQDENIVIKSEPPYVDHYEGRFQEQNSVKIEPQPENNNVKTEAAGVEEYEACNGKFFVLVSFHISAIFSIILELYGKIYFNYFFNTFFTVEDLESQPLTENFVYITVKDEPMEVWQVS